MKKMIRHLNDLAVGGVFALIYLFLYMIPFKCASNVGAKIGSVLGKRTGLAKKAHKNLRLAMPELTESDYDRIVSDMCIGLSRSVAEISSMFEQDLSSDNSLLEIVGSEHLEAVKASGKGAIFCVAHIANWFYIPYICRQSGLYTALMYRKPNNSYVDFFFKKALLKGASELLPKGAAGGKRMISLLKQGKSVVIAVDQKMNDGIAVPFFGVDAMTAPAVARLGMKFDCPIIPVRAERLAHDDVKSRVTFYPPVPIPEDGSASEKTYSIMYTINQIFESWIRERPEQWLWVHSRWPKDAKNKTQE